jgi:hypothetical protein
MDQQRRPLPFLCLAACISSRAAIFLDEPHIGEGTKVSES